MAHFWDALYIIFSTICMFLFLFQEPMSLNQVKKEEEEEIIAEETWMDEVKRETVRSHHREAQLKTEDEEMLLSTPDIPELTLDPLDTRVLGKCTAGKPHACEYCAKVCKNKFLLEQHKRT